MLQKLGITELNEMQQKAAEVIERKHEIVLLSPTGTGKTVAFLLPLIKLLSHKVTEIQALILVPSRELAIQIEQVARDLGSGFKVSAVYGGRSGNKDKIDLKHAPAILIGTPGRVADHLRRENIGVSHIKTLVLDEFDKSLEVGFEKEMKEIVFGLPALDKKILTSATKKAEIPGFVGIHNPYELDFLDVKKKQLDIKSVVSPSLDKSDTLIKLLSSLDGKRGIVFCNLKESLSDVSYFLEQQKISHASFYGGLEQQDRERALIKFRNGSENILLATDLAARGIDVPELDFIIHYELPYKAEEFTHRNGRTARMHASGTAYIIRYKDERLPEFIKGCAEVEIEDNSNVTQPKWETVFVSGGRKDKISKGDIAGFFFKQGGLKSDELGNIELKQDCAFVAVASNKVNHVLQHLNNEKLKTKKVRLYTIE